MVLHVSWGNDGPWGIFCLEGGNDEGQGGCDVSWEDRERERVRGEVKILV